MKFSKTTFTLPPVGIGTWAWGNDGAFGETLPEEILREIFQEAVRRGFTLFDTAPVYGDGRSEEILGRFLRKMPDSPILISDKLTPQHMPAGSNPVGTMLSLEEKRLGRRVDLLWIHNAWQAPRWTKEAAAYFGNQWESDFQENDGKFRKPPLLGISNHSLPLLQEAEGILNSRGLQVSCVQQHYSLLHRNAETTGLLQYCRERGIAFFSYMVLEQGALSGKYSAAHEMPKNSERGKIYNRIFAKLSSLNGEILEAAGGFHVQTSAIPIAYALWKGTIPVVGITSPFQLNALSEALALIRNPDLAVQKRLSSTFLRLEHTADDSDVHVNRIWER